MTAEHLAALSGDGPRYELVDGELQTKAPVDDRQAAVAARALGRVLVFVEDHRLGEVLTTRTGFVVHGAPDTQGAPDLVVEVVSPSDRAGRVNATALAWLDAGVRLVWVVYPETRSVAVHRLEGIGTILRDDAVLDGADVLPGFTIALPDLFRRG